MPDFVPLAPLLNGGITPPAGSEGGEDGFVPLGALLQKGASATDDGIPGDGPGEATVDPMAGKVRQGFNPLHSAVTGLLNDPVDAAKGAAKGVANAAQETLQTLNSGVGALGQKVLDVASGGKETLQTAEVRQELAGAEQAVDRGIQAVGDLVPEAQTIGGNLVTGVSQFLTGMVGAGKILKAAQLLQKGGKAALVARGMVEGAAVDAVAFDPFEGRLSNLIEEYPSLHNPVTEYLAAKPEDSEAEGRFKNALEGLGLGVAVEGLLAAVKGVRNVRTAKAAGKDGMKELEAALDEVDAQAAANPSQKPPRATISPNPTQGTPKAESSVLGSPKADGSASAQVAPKPLLTDEAVEAVIRDAQADSFLSQNYVEDIWRHDKIDAAGGVKVVLETVGEGVAKKIQTRTGGVQTWKETIDLADSMGMKPEEVMAGLSGLAKNVEKQAALVLTARRMQNGLAKEITEEARRLDHGVTKDRGRINAMIQKLAEIESTLAPVRTAQARGTRQWGIIADDVASQQTIRAIIASGGDANVVAKLLKPKSGLRKAIDVHNEVWINALLSGPKTHIINSTSNLLMAIARPSERMLGGQVTEGLHEFMGMARGIKDAVSMAAKAFKLEASILDPMVSKIDAPRFATAAANMGVNPKSFMGSSLDWLGKAVRLPSRFLIAEDEFFKQLNYRGAVYSTAAREGAEKGLTGKALAEYVESRFQAAFDGSGKAMDDGALREAKISTFQEDLTKGSLAETISQTVTKHPALRLILPFVRTPVNIVKQVGHRTPGVNLLLESYRADFKAGGSRRAQAIGKFATGGMLYSAAALLALEGRITGRGPTDKAEREAKLATGWRPYSVEAFGTYIGFERLDPFGMILGLTADFVEAAGQMSEQTRGEMALAMTAALARNLSSKTYLRGLTEALEALSEPDRKFERWWMSRVGSYVPAAVPQVGGLVTDRDPYMREVRSEMDAIMAKIPGLSDKLPPRRNVFGEPIQLPPGFGPDSISPFTYSKVVNDEVKQELSRLEGGISLPTEKIRQGRIDLTSFTKNGQDAYDRLLELRLTTRRGRYTLHERLEKLITSDRYKNLPEGTDLYTSQKLKEIQEVFGEYSEATMRRLREEYPDLDKALRADDQNQRLAKRPNGGNSIADLLAPLIPQQ